MTNKSRLIKGRPLSVGNGLTVYFKIKENYFSTSFKASHSGVTELVVEVGNLKNAQWSTVRKMAPNRISGLKNAIGHNVSTRLTQISLEMESMNSSNLELIKNMVSNRSDDNDLTLEEVLADAETLDSTINIETIETESGKRSATTTRSIKHMSQLPFMDIIIIGVADDFSQLDMYDGEKKFEANALYKMELKDIKILQETGGFAVGEGYSDSVLQGIACSNVQHWEKI